ncbi:MAG: hypothetical protein V1896_02590 [Candidatus Zambryskibacteria bacterium]
MNENHKWFFRLFFGTGFLGTGLTLGGILGASVSLVAIETSQIKPSVFHIFLVVVCLVMAVIGIVLIVKSFSHDSTH